MTRPTPFVAGNWKMHMGADDATSFSEGLVAEDLPHGVDVVVCPPFVSLPATAMILSGSSIAVGAQNAHWEDSGAFTGEVAPPMLAELGVEWVIVGHSERRTLFGETDESAARRAAAVQRAGLGVIYCIGETLEQRDDDATMQVLESQCAVLGGLDPRRLVVAYEPVWAIGTGRTASAEQAQEAHAFVRGRLTSLFDAHTAATVRIVYGGSLKPDNAAELLALDDVDGGLIGGASLDVSSFSSIIRAAADRTARE
jgi:triosephosphate isomerase